MLKRDIKIGTDVGMSSHDGQKAFGDPFRFGVHETESNRGKLLGKLLEKPSDVLVTFKVLAPDTRILPDEHDLLRSPTDEVLSLHQDTIWREAVVAATDQGDGAEGTPTVASVRDLEVGPNGCRGGCCNLASRNRDAEGITDHFDDIILLAARNEAVSLWKRLR